MLNSDSHSPTYVYVSEAISIFCVATCLIVV